MAVSNKTIDRACFCCEGKEGSGLQLGSWSIAGIGEVNLTIRICARCGAVLQDPALNEDAMGFYYKNYSNYANESSGGLPRNVTVVADSRQIDIIQKFLAPGRAFEVGCATGSLLLQRLYAFITEWIKLPWSRSLASA